MAKGTPVVLDTRSFTSMLEAKAYFKAMLNRYRPRQRVSNEDAADLASLLKRHVEYRDKAGVGVDHFEVMRADYGTQCFRIVRKDGTGEDFSYLHCIVGSRAK